MWRDVAFSLFFALASVFGTASAIAQTDAESSLQPAFRELMQEGLRLREEGNDDEALSVFRRCLEMLPESGEAVGQVAFAEMALGRLVLAEAHLQEALAHTDDEWVRRHRSTLEEARRSLSVQIVTVTIPLEGAQVTFEESGETVSRETPVTLRLSPGRHELRVTSPGFQPEVSVLEVEAGQQLTHLPPRRAVATTPPVAQRAEESTNFEARDRYQIRSTRLHIHAAVFATGALGTGVAAFFTRPTTDVFGDRDPRTGINRFLIGAALTTAAVAVGLFVAARITRGKRRRQNSDPSQSPSAGPGRATFGVP